MKVFSTIEILIHRVSVSPSLRISASPHLPIPVSPHRPLSASRVVMAAPLLPTYHHQHLWAGGDAALAETRLRQVGD